MNLASKSRFYLDLAVLGTNLKFIYFTTRFPTLDLFNNLDIKDNLKEEEEESKDDELLNEPNLKYCLDLADPEEVFFYIQDFFI